MTAAAAADLTAYEALPARMFRPARPRLAETLHALLGTDASWLARALSQYGPAPAYHSALEATGARPASWEAWERCATRGLIPDDAVESPSRAFRVEVSDAAVSQSGRYAYARSPGGVVRFDPVWRRERSSEVDLPHPAVLADVVALASDWANVVHVEALAAEAIERLAAWGAPRAGRVVWHVAAPGVLRASAPYAGSLASPGQTDYGSARFDLGDRELEAWLASQARRAGGGRERAVRELFQRAGYEQRGRLVPLVVRHMRWQLVAARGPIVPSATATRDPVAPAANPYEPLLEIARCGYWVRTVADGDVVIEAAPLDDDETPASTEVRGAS